MRDENGPDGGSVKVGIERFFNLLKRFLDTHPICRKETIPEIVRDHLLVRCTLEPEACTVLRFIRTDGAAAEHFSPDIKLPAAFNQLQHGAAASDFNII